MTKVPIEKTPMEKMPAEEIPTEKRPAESTPRLNWPAERHPAAVELAAAALGNGGWTRPITKCTMTATQVQGRRFVPRGSAGGIRRVKAGLLGGSGHQVPGIRDQGSAECDGRIAEDGESQGVVAEGERRGGLHTMCMKRTNLVLDAGLLLEARVLGAKTHPTELLASKCRCADAMVRP